jgi:hypothetical protein
MLSQTKDTIEILRACGLKRKEFRVRTPWNRKVQGYDASSIVLLCPQERKLALVPALAKRFKTTVLYLNGQAWHVQVEPGQPGLYQYENGQEIKVQQEAELLQLALW